MINNLNILLPEVLLSLSIFIILMVGVFIKNSFNIIFNLTSLIIILIITIIITNPQNEVKIFLDSFTRDGFSNYFKILILISSLFVLNSSKNFIVDNKLDKFEYPIIILLSIHLDQDNKSWMTLSYEPYQDILIFYVHCKIPVPF